MTTWLYAIRIPPVSNFMRPWRNSHVVSGEVILPQTCSRFSLDPAGYRTSHNTLYVKFASNHTLGKTTRLFCLNRKCGFDLQVTSTKFGGSQTEVSCELATF